MEKKSFFTKTVDGVKKILEEDKRRQKEFEKEEKLRKEGKPLIKNFGNGIYFFNGLGFDGIGLEELLKSLSKFKDAHPELELVSVAPTTGGGELYTYITGIIVIFRPKQK